MPENAVAEKRDPVRDTHARLTSIGRAVPLALIAAAWRAELFPELASRVGERISAGLSDEALREFEALSDAEADTSAWLTVHAPDYPRMVVEECDRLVGEAVAWFAVRSAAPGGAEVPR